MSKNKRLKENKPKDVTFTGNKDKSPKVHQRDKLDLDLHIIERELTPKQQAFMELALDKNTKMMLILGPAGTTKTYLAILAALKLLQSHRVSDLIYVRSIVESADVKMGTLPGEADDKMSPYTRPLVDKLDELLPRGDIQYLIKDKRVEGLPIGYLRGLNWNAKVIIGDEMQNCTKKELITLMTRTGEFSKVFLLGDPQQSDINGKSGFQSIYNLFSDEESYGQGISTFQFFEEDCLRSELVKYIIKKIKSLG
jgi:phosphate starvation-inducible protein PhoH and related proteins